MSSLSSVGFIERIKGTEVRDLSRAAYLGRYTWVCMSTSSLRAAVDMAEKGRDRNTRSGNMALASSGSSIREEVVHFFNLYYFLYIYLFQITELSNALALVQSRLLQLAKGIEETDNWKSRCTDLEVAYKEALTGAKWLRAQNAELERKMANHKPEVNKVLSAHEDGFQKLKHARKVIRDLLDERVTCHGDSSISLLIFGIFKGDMKSPSAPIHQEDIDQALYGDLQRGEDSPSTDSDKTVRLAAAQHSQESLESGSIRAHTTRRCASEDDSLDVESEHSVASPLPQASQISTQTPEEQSHKTRRGPQWRIHYKKPPGTSVVTDGPLSPSTLENDLSMDDNMVRRYTVSVWTLQFILLFQISSLQRSVHHSFLGF